MKFYIYSDFLYTHKTKLAISVCFTIRIISGKYSVVQATTEYVHYNEAVLLKRHLITIT